MAFRAIMLLAATIIFITSEVSSYEEKSVLEASFVKPPVKTPTVLPPAPLVKPPVKTPTVLPPVKAPSPAPTKPVKVLPPVSLEACPGLCKGRCAAHSKFDHCMRVCKTCCNRCRCVPPGTYGNKEMCGTCYVNMTTHGGRPKCP